MHLYTQCYYIINITVYYIHLQFVPWFDPKRHWPSTPLFRKIPQALQENTHANATAPQRAKHARHLHLVPRSEEKHVRPPNWGWFEKRGIRGAIRVLPKNWFLYFDDLDAVDNVDDDYHYHYSYYCTHCYITSTWLCLINNRSLQRSASIYQFSKHTWHDRWHDRWGKDLEVVSPQLFRSFLDFLTSFSRCVSFRPTLLPPPPPPPPRKKWWNFFIASIWHMMLLRKKIIHRMLRGKGIMIVIIDKWS